jgi:hypothetical protein
MKEVYYIFFSKYLPGEAEENKENLLLGRVVSAAMQLQNLHTHKN